MADKRFVISVDSSMFGIDGTVDLIIRIADKKLGL